MSGCGWRVVAVVDFTDLVLVVYVCLDVVVGVVVDFNVLELVVVCMYIWMWLACCCCCCC